MITPDQISTVKPPEGDPLDLAARFPGVVTAEARPGYKGWIIPK